MLIGKFCLGNQSKTSTMRTIKTFLLLLFCVMATYVNAQNISDIKPNKNGKMGEFTEWAPLDVKGADGSTATIEYRLALVGRTGIACNYVIEVKNLSKDKVEVIAIAKYYDKLVKGNYRIEKKMNVKPGKTASQKFITQGCKKDKGVEADDYGHCMNCEFSVALIATK